MAYYGFLTASNGLYIGVNVAWKPTPSRVPQVCKFDRHVTLFGSLLVRSKTTHVFLYFIGIKIISAFLCSSVWKIKISVIKGNNFYYTFVCAFQFLSVISGALRICNICSPFMVTVAEAVAQTVHFIRFFETGNIKNVVIIPKSLHLGVQLHFILLGMKVKGT